MVGYYYRIRDFKTLNFVLFCFFVLIFFSEDDIHDRTFI